MTTQAPERVKLQAAGTSLVMRVESAVQVPEGKYPEYAFVGLSVGGQGQRVELRVPKASAERQLGRLEMVLADTIGKTLLFSRDENSNDESKPYWSIVLASGANGTGGPALAGAAGGGQSAASNIMPPVTTPAPHSDRLYTKIATYYCDEIIPILKRAGVSITHEGTSAAIAAIFIAANQKH